MQINTVNIAKPVNMRPIDTIILHCSATPDGRDVTVEEIRQMHLKNGWNDIGYHFVIYRDGSIHTGRPLKQIGAHAAGHNTGSIGICYIGGMDKENKKAQDTRTPQQQQALLYLVKQLIQTFGNLHIYGHNELSSKSCPCFNVPAWASANHLFDTTTVPMPPAPKREEETSWLDQLIESVRKALKPGNKNKTETPDIPPVSERRSTPMPDMPLKPLEENYEELDAPEEPGWWNENL